MNNSKYFKSEFMPLPIKTIGSPKSVFVSDGQGLFLDLAIPVYGTISVAEQDLIDKIDSEKGYGSLNPLIGKIAKQIAPNNGGDPSKVAEALIKYKNANGKVNPDPLDGYYGHFEIHCPKDTKQFFDAVDRGNLQKWNFAACAHALLNRVPDLDKINGSQWKTENALDPAIVPPTILTQLYLLYLVEANGLPLEKHTKMVERDGVTRNEFTFNVNEKPATAPKEEDAKTADAAVKELAGKS